ARITGRGCKAPGNCSRQGRWKRCDGNQSDFFHRPEKEIAPYLLRMPGMSQYPATAVHIPCITTYHPCLKPNPDDRLGLQNHPATERKEAGRIVNRHSSLDSLHL